MRLHDIESAYLLPRFAHNAEWEQKALDQVVKGVRAKSFAMGAPYTSEAISALSDAELQAFYFQYGIAIYYPDLSRETRENMLFELARVYRSLGTPHSVELLCEYIFDGADKVVVEIHDNLAFNAAGELVDDSLLDLFDVDLFPTSPTLSQDKIERIVENIFRFCRNSQTLRDIIIEFPDVAELPIAACDLEAFVYTIGGDEIAEEPQPVAVLPTVSVTGDWGSGNWLYVGVSAEYVYANASRLLYISPGGNQLLYDASKSYSPMRYTSSNGGSYKSPVGKFTISGNSDATAKVVVNNITSSNLVLYSISVAVCSSNQATVVTVYDSQNTAYNAFKFTAGGADYYYVLDSVQTDWTDDLSSIGYSLTQTLEIVLALRYDPSTSQWKTVAFDQTPAATENYWWGCVIDQAGVTALQAIGLTYHDPSSIWGGSKFTGPIGNVVYNSGYSYEVIALYSDMGTTEVAQSLLPSLTLEPLNRHNTDLLTIWSKNVLDTTPVKTWKVRISKNS